MKEATSNMIASLYIRALLVIFAWVLAIISPYSISAQNTGKPFIENYSYKDYLAHPQNFAVLQDSRGVIYVANYGGILEYDGTAWRHIGLPNNAHAVTLLDAPDGNIYVGGNNEAGYLAPDAKGQMHYYSLMPNIQAQSVGEGLDFSRIVAHGDSIYLIDPFTLFILHDGKITAQDHTTYGEVASIDGQLVMPNEAFILSLLKNGRLEPIAGSEVLPEGNAIIRILKTDYNKVLLVYEQEIYEFPLPFSTDYSKPVPYRKFTNVISKEAQYINDATYLGKGITALSTSGLGVIFIDSTGQQIRSINKSDGLKENYVWGVYKDRQGSLWMALDNGIARTPIEPDFTYWDDTRGVKGYVIDMLKHEGNVYVGTTSGVYKLLPSGQFELVKGGNLEVFRMQEFIIPNSGGKKILLVGGIWGIFQLEGDELKQLPIDKSSIAAMTQSAIDSAVVYIGSGDLLAIRYEEGTWKLQSQLGDLTDIIHAIVEDKDGSLWIKTPPKDVIHLTPTAIGKLDHAKITTYGHLAPPPSQDGVNIMRLPNGEVLFGTGMGILSYHPDEQEKNQRFQPSNYLGERYGDQAFFSINKMQMDLQENVWFSATQNDNYWIETATKLENTYTKDSISFVKLYNTYVECIYPEDNGNVWFGGPDGLFRYNAHTASMQQAPPACLITKVTANKDSVLTYGGGTGKVALLPYFYNNIAFNYSLPSFVSEKASQFNYRLVGYDDRWSGWGNERKKEYTNLGENTYTFEVLARDTSGKESQMASYTFTIKPPWYRTWVAYFTYLLLIVVIVFVGIKLNTQRLVREKQRLESVVQERTREVVLKNAELEQQKEEIMTQAESLKEAHESVMRQNLEIENQKSEIISQHDILADQNKEISSQRDKIEQAYKNVTVLSEIGQSITSHLKVESIIDTVYHSVNALMDATGFGIGIYNERMNRLDFPGFIEKDEKLPFHFNPVSKVDALASWCYVNQDEIFINDFEKEVKTYLPNHRTGSQPGETPSSIIYLPLKSQGKTLGVITVQSFEKYTYSRYQLDMLRNIAIYTGIALENASVYQQISKKNRNITDSINYAQNIQRAMLPTEAEIKNALPHAFVLFQPRDIVSGDFYWLAQSGHQTIIAAVDCTGHGVPGAFMSLVGDGFLKQLVNMKGLTAPAAILSELHELVHSALHQQDSNNRDGMDMAICCIDHQEQTLRYAGAKNALVYVKNDGSLHTIKADKLPIGGQHHVKERIFTEHLLPLDGETMYFMYTDGYQDQFGGEQDAKLSRRNFHHLLGSIHHLEADKQKYFLESFMKDWIGRRNQIDDILVIGFKA